MNLYWYLGICLVLVVVIMYAIVYYICDAVDDDDPEEEREERAGMDPQLASELNAMSPQFGGFVGL